MNPVKTFALAIACSGLAVGAWAEAPPPATEAPAAFDGLTNGFVDQDTFDDTLADFAGQEGISDGLGPVYNAQSCGECHQNPVTGGISQITELRAGHFNGNIFVDHPGGSLINDRAVDASIQERILGGNEVRTFRTSLNTLGDGFIESINSNTIVAIANSQPPNVRGQVIQVEILEAPGNFRVGRFGWKNQHASLFSFSGDAYTNEMGITTPLVPNENSSNGASVAAFDPLPDPDEPDNDDLDAFSTFMRATKAPPRDTVLANTPDAQAGSTVFNQIGCAVCHVRNITTADVGTVINGGTFTVPEALGNKIIHPFSDFLLHDIGTGDGIVQNGGQSTRTKVRTPPLWGLRTRDRIMHDGNSLTRPDAIARHGGQAAGARANYNNLSNNKKNQLLTFLNSL